MNIGKIALGLMGALIVTPGLSAEITECDRLVSHPLDPDRVTEGVPTSAVKHAEGIAACTAALEEDQQNPRLNYQLGRVYFYDGQPDKAMPHLKVAAAAGYRQAQFVLGYIYDSGSSGEQPDSCKAEELWAASARSGRLAALVSYPHHFLRGRFAACDVSVSKDEMMQFLERAKERRLDYYQNMLVNDLVEDLKGS